MVWPSVQEQILCKTVDLEEYSPFIPDPNLRTEIKAQMTCSPKK